MKLLISKHDMNGRAAHLVDEHGNQICRTSIKRSDWHIVDRSPDGIVICYHCKRIQALKAKALGE